MIKSGILGEDDPVERIEGHLALKMPRGPEHDSAIRALNKRLQWLVPDTYALSNPRAVAINNSEPEPDFTVARAGESLFRTRHPGRTKRFSSLAHDRSGKACIYAQAGIRFNRS